MSRPDQETFDRDVSYIRRKYGGDEELTDPASAVAFLFRLSRMRVKGGSDPAAENSLVGLIRLSESDKYMWDAVNMIAEDYLTDGEVLPDPLAHWVADRLADQTRPGEAKLRPRPRKGRRLRVRDWMMWLAVADLAERGYAKVRWEGEAEASAEGGTACDVVAKAFDKSYNTVEDVWYRKPVGVLSFAGSPKGSPR